MAKRRKGNNRSKKNGTWFKKYGTAEKVPCCWCGKMLLFNEATLEHLLPKAFGGTNEYSNLDIACAECNNKRGFLDKPIIKAFREKLYKAKCKTEIRNIKKEMLNIGKQRLENVLSLHNS